jgi:tetratricopeptide (TPR) repeat protein
VFHDELGTVLKQRGERGKAIASYHEALEKDPDYFRAANNLGTVYAEGRHFEKALEFATRAHELRPLEDRTLYNLATVHSQYGLELGMKGDLKAAEKHLRTAIHLLPTYAEAHYNLGVALLKGGDPRAAIASFEEALRLKPDYARARQTMMIAKEELQQD